ncbi:MAG: PEP-CTERM sorting domain-containing protein [Opitutaceae bacterium]|jgi:autotransporter-associated beta strand protein|nr:PEP-CTERM sorting domain-containing protein [Opitutaceae bacterium]
MKHHNAMPANPDPITPNTNTLNTPRTVFPLRETALCAVSLRRLHEAAWSRCATRLHGLSALALALALLVTTAPLPAEWTGGGTDPAAYWATDNWLNGAIDHTFSGTIGWTAATTLDAGIAGETLDFNGGITLTYTDARNLTLRQTGTSTSASTWNLNGDIYVNLAAITANPDTGVTASDVTQTVQLGNTTTPLINLNFGGATRTITINEGKAINSGGLDALAIYADLTNGNIIKAGGGTLRLNTQSTLDGTITLTGGTLLVQGGNTVTLPNVSHLALGGMMSRFVINTTSTDTINDAATIDLNGGMFVHNDVGNNTSTTERLENIGAVTMSGTRSVIGVISTAGKPATILQAASLTRDPYSTLNIVSANNTTLSIGNGNARLLVTSDADILATLKGTSDTAGSTNLKILPWATATQHGNIGLGSIDSSVYCASGGLVTYTHDGGFRVLTADEYQTDLASAATDDNVKLTGGSNGDVITLATDKTVNSLFFLIPNNTPVLDLGGHTLTIGSGLLASSAYQYTLRNGALHLNGTGYLMTGRGIDTFANTTTITAESGLVVASNGRLQLQGTMDAGAGPLVINSGALYLQGNNRLVSTTNLRIDNSASLAMDTNATTQTLASLSGRGTVNLNNANSKLYVGATFAGTAANREVIIGDGGSITPGDVSGENQAGTLTFSNTNKLRFENGSILNIEIASADIYDRINLSLATGAFAFENGATLNLSVLNGYKMKDGDTFRLFTIAGESVASTAITGLQNLAIVGDDGFTYALDEMGQLTVHAVPAPAVPEPATTALVLAALCATTTLLLLRRKK